MHDTFNTKDLSDEQLINKYYHTRLDFEAYEVSTDRELLPLLKYELLQRMKTPKLVECSWHGSRLADEDGLCPHCDKGKIKL